MGRGGGSGKRRKMRKVKGKKEQRRGQEVDKEGDGIRCEFKFRKMESGWGWEELDWNTISHWSTFTNLSVKHTDGIETLQ